MVEFWQDTVFLSSAKVGKSISHWMSNGAYLHDYDDRKLRHFIKVSTETTKQNLGALTPTLLILSAMFWSRIVEGGADSIPNRSGIFGQCMRSVSTQHLEELRQSLICSSKKSSNGWWKIVLKTPHPYTDLISVNSAFWLG